jgi:hypothetical protein
MVTSVELTDQLWSNYALRIVAARSVLLLVKKRHRIRSGLARIALALIARLKV